MADPVDPPVLKGWGMPVVDEALLQRIRTYASIGATKANIAWALGIHPTTLYRAEKRNPELTAAFAQGKNEGLLFVMGKVRKLIETGDKTAMFFYLKCQAGWRERGDAPTVNVGVGVQVDAKLASLYDEWKAEEEKRAGSSSRRTRASSAPSGTTPRA